MHMLFVRSFNFSCKGLDQSLRFISCLLSCRYHSLIYSFDVVSIEYKSAAFQELTSHLVVFSLDVEIDKEID